MHKYIYRIHAKIRIYIRSFVTENVNVIAADSEHYKLIPFEMVLVPFKDDGRKITHTHRHGNVSVFGFWTKRQCWE